MYAQLMHKYGDEMNNKTFEPVFKGKGTTFIAYCPSCDKPIKHYLQETCETCGRKLKWQQHVVDLIKAQQHE